MNFQINTLEEIKAILEGFRQESTTRQKFPKELWEAILHLTKVHSIQEIGKRLKISPSYLKRKISQSQASPTIDFQEISYPLQGGHSDSIIIELSLNSGLKAKIQGPLSCLSCLQTLFKR
jgi:transposase